jgi:hypothetical protein
LITLSSTPTTIIENWTGVNEILFTSGTVTMEDVSINSPVPVPEPASLVLVGSGLLALTGLAKRKLCRQPQLPNSGSC